MKWLSSGAGAGGGGKQTKLYRHLCLVRIIACVTREGLGVIGFLSGRGQSCTMSTPERDGNPSYLLVTQSTKNEKKKRAYIFKFILRASGISLSKSFTSKCTVLNAS